MPKSHLVLLAVILALSLAVRLVLSQIPGYFLDLQTFSSWYQRAAENGLSQFYDPPHWSDYPPFNVYIFWLFGKIALSTGLEASLVFQKLPQNLFDIATCILLFIFLRRYISPKAAIFATAIYAFNPATIFNLAIWGQMDSVYTFFIVGTIMALIGSKYELSGGLFAFGVLTKPQTAILLPVVAYIILKNGGWRRALFSSAVFWAVIFIVIIPFNWENPVVFLVERYAGYFVYPYTSINAYNFWALDGFWDPDTVTFAGLTLQTWGLAGFILLAAFILWQLRRNYEPGSAIFAIFLLMFSFFMVMTRMHERYLFPTLAILIMVFPLRITLCFYAGITATYLFNLAYILPYLNADSAVPSGDWSIFVIVPANAAILILSLLYFCRMQRSRSANNNGKVSSFVDARL